MIWVAISVFLKGRRIDFQMTRAFYLHTSVRLDCDTVFYKVAGEERAKVLLQLFRKQYTLSGNDDFFMTPEDWTARR